MASQTDPSAPSRVPLSLDRVLRTAVDLADAAGIESLTMRKLAQELGVEAMSLYYYVSKKDDLLDRMIDIVVSEFELPPGGPDWKAALRRSAISAHDVLSRHPWAGSLVTSASVRSARLRYMDAILRRLREAGFSIEMTHHAYHALDSHIIGFTLWEVGFPAETELLDLAATFLEQLPVDEYPYLAEHIQHHLADTGDEAGEFEFGLDLLLDGLDRLRGRPEHGARTIGATSP
jgi:AcrR family transcriptional regulator